MVATPKAPRGDYADALEAEVMEGHNTLSDEGGVALEALISEPADPTTGPSTPTGRASAAAATGGAVPGRVTTELQIEGDLVALFCRRGRWRLRELQAVCCVALDVDRQRRTVRITGAPADVAAARAQLSYLSGHSRLVSAAVWAELMRTRTTYGDNEPGTLSRLQEESGCRLHIERSRREVRLFGAPECVARAERLLEELDTQCVQEVVPVGKADVPAGALQVVAHSCRVSLCAEEKQVVVLGVRANVAAAVLELKSFAATADPAPKPSRAALPLTQSGSRHRARQTAGADARDGEESGKQPGSQGGGRAPQDSWSRGQGAWRAALGVDGPWTAAPAPLSPAAAQQRRSANAAAAAATAAAPPPNLQELAAACPTCGSGQHCGSCGAVVWQVPGLFQVAFQSVGAGSGSAGGPPRTPSGTVSWDGVPAGAPVDGQHWAQQQQQQPQHLVAVGREGRGAAAVGGGGPAAGVQHLVPVCLLPAPYHGQQGGHAAGAPFTQTCVMQATGSETGYALCAVPAPTLVYDPRSIGG